LFDFYILEATATDGCFVYALAAGVLQAQLIVKSAPLEANLSGRAWHNARLAHAFSLTAIN
jgi:hypothetical protein